jgi:hypothetical protein
MADRRRAGGARGRMIAGAPFAASGRLGQPPAAPNRLFYTSLNFYRLSFDSNKILCAASGGPIAPQATSRRPAGRSQRVERELWPAAETNQANCRPSSRSGSGRGQSIKRNQRQGRQAKWQAAAGGALK